MGVLKIVQFQTLGLWLWLGLWLRLGLGLGLGLGLVNCHFQNNIWRHLLNILLLKIKYCIARHDGTTAALLIHMQVEVPLSNDDKVIIFLTQTPLRQLL